MMAYYDQIAKNWHKASGYKGGSFKKYVLNDMLLREMSAVAGRSILELGAGGLRLPIVPRRLSKYERLLSEAGFTWDKSDVYVTEKVLREKPGLRRLGNKPLALILRCQRI